MKRFEQIREKHEDRILAKAKSIEEKRLHEEQARQEAIARKEQARQEAIERKQKYVEKLLNSPIEKDYIARLHYYVRDNQGDIMYGIYDYFLCSVRRLDFGYGDDMTVVKITGDNIGEKYTMYGHGYSISSLELYDKEGRFWEGKTTGDLYIPSDCKTIRELNDYTNKNNVKSKKEYEQKVANTVRVREEFLINHKPLTNFSVF